MAKKVASYIKLQVPAGQANPSPPVGPALGQHGVNIMEFCKAFNAQTQGVEPGLPIPVIITVYSDRSFTFISKTPPAAVLLRKAAGIAEGFRHAEHRQGRQGQSCAARRDCHDQDAGPDRGRHGRGRTHGCRHGAQHGHRSRGSELMAVMSKRKKAAREKVDRTKAYEIDDALGLVKELATAKFPESIDVSVNLGVDPRKSDQVVRGSTVLPNGTGKSVRVAVFAQGENADKAKAAGADIVGFEDLAEKRQEAAR